VDGERDGICRSRPRVIRIELLMIWNANTVYGLHSIQPRFFRNEAIRLLGDTKARKRRMLKRPSIFLYIHTSFGQYIGIDDVYLFIAKDSEAGVFFGVLVLSLDPLLQRFVS
jgi:hypothetical protein